jgi:cation/acetate symporter
MSTMNQRVINNPKFQNLVVKRGRYAWSLSILVLAVFYGFVLLVAFQPTLIGSPISEGSAWTYGVVGGLSLGVGVRGP